MLCINHRHCRVTMYLHYPLPSEPWQCALCRAWVNIKDSNCSLLSWRVNFPPERRDGEGGLCCRSCFFCFVSLYEKKRIDLLILLKSQVSQTAFYEFWSNTTLKAGAVPLYSLKCVMDKLYGSDWDLVPHSISRHKDWNKTQLSCFWFLYAFLWASLLLKCVYESHSSAK